ncbi:MAG: FMN-binding protein [Candidatus Gracilibacteria bacterium]|nr:FMN-binding protein [Candidatus Gracilibacteria bacterium]MDD2908416.1 FMN-binding protein [Candidatus Gracilibacteria bacterium]
MKTKKTILKIIVIGSIFIFSGFNFTYLVSINDSNLSGFWMTRNFNINIDKVSANDDYDDDYEGGDNYNTNTTTSPSGTTTTNPTNNTTSGASGVSSTNQTTNPTNNTISSGLFVDGIYIGEGYYASSKGTKFYTVEVTILGGKITSAKWLKFISSGNGLYSESMGNLELEKLIKNQTYGINTFSGATGTSNAVNNAIKNALNKAKQDRTVPVQITNSNTIGSTYVLSDMQKNNLEQKLNIIFIKLEDKLSTPNFIAALKKANIKIESKINNGNSKTKAILVYVKDLINIKISEPETKTFVSPNGNIYKIHQLASGEYIFERSDGTVSTTKFYTFSAIRNYLYENTLYVVDSIYIAPNGSQFTIIQNQNDLTYKFKWANGTLGTNVYVSKEILLYNLKTNNPAPIILQKTTPVPVVKTTTTPTKVNSPKVNPTPITNSTKPTTTTPPINTNTKAS